jgi:hypothetical protein
MPQQHFGTTPLFPSLFVRADGIITGRLRRNLAGVLVSTVDTNERLYDGTRGLAGTDKRCMSVSPTDGLRRAAIILPIVGVILIVSMVARPLPGEQTPWEFFRDALPHVDTFSKGLGLAFFTTVLTFMNFLALVARLRLSFLLPIALIALMLLAVFSPAVRESRLVRVGFGLVTLGVVPLLIAGTFTDNPLGFGFLFAFLTPIGLLLIVSGAIFALATRESPDRRNH